VSNSTYKKDGNNLIETRIVNGKEKTRIIPIYDKYGEYTKELCLVAKKEAAKQEMLEKLQARKQETKDLFASVAKSPEANKMGSKEVASFEEEIVEDDIDDLDDNLNNDFFDGKSKIVSETKEPDNNKMKKSLLALGALTATAIIIACCVKGCQKEEVPVQPEITTEVSANDVSENEAVDTGMSLDDMINDTRYTTITEDILVETTNNVIDELADHGIEISSDDALSFVAITNITHLEETNPELLQQVLGDNPDAEQNLSKVGHIIGQIVTLEVTEKDEQVDWTIAIIDPTDRAIAQANVAMVEDIRTMANNDLSYSDSKEVQTMIQDQYIAPNYDKTVGYDLLDGTHTAMSQEDGADFVTDAIITGILMGDNQIKNYIYGTETYDDLQAISWNEDVTSNVMRMIEECENVDVYVETKEGKTM